MGDLISRQAVDEIIDNLLKNDNLQASPSVWHGLHMIKQLPSAQPEPSQVARDIATLVENEQDMRVMLKNAQPEQQWIPCERELPEDYTDVLAWFEYFRYGDYNLYQTYGIGSYSMKYDSWMINHETGWHKLRVIAWMPLPEPYKGEQE